MGTVNSGNKSTDLANDQGTVHSPAYVTTEPLYLLPYAVVMLAYSVQRSIIVDLSRTWQSCRAVFNGIIYCKLESPS
jgi:hypothetical protein